MLALLISSVASHHSLTFTMILPAYGHHHGTAPASVEIVFRTAALCYLRLALTNPRKALCRAAGVGFRVAQSSALPCALLPYC